MSIFDSVMVSMLGLSIVFIVLIALSLVVKVQSLLFGVISKSKNVVTENKDPINENITVEMDNSSSYGELKLVGTDEKTAAMVMAIVSDESQIPISELQFKYIKALN